MRVWGLPHWLVRGVVRVIVAVLVTASAAPLQHTFDPHDTECCDPAIVIHDASQHRFEADTPRDADQAGDHCAACHASRAFSPNRLTASSTPVLVDAAPVVYTTAPTPSPQLDLRVPARAPPALA